MSNQAHDYHINEDGTVKVRCHQCGRFLHWSEVRTYTTLATVPEHQEPFYLCPARSVRHRDGTVETEGRTIMVTFLKAQRMVERTSCTRCRKARTTMQVLDFGW